MNAVVTADINRAGRKQAAAKYATVDNPIPMIPVVMFQNDNELTLRFETPAQQTPYDTNAGAVGLGTVSKPQVQ